MKIRHPLAIRSAAFVLSVWLRTWMSMSRVHEEFADRSAHPKEPGGRYVYLFWHEALVPMAACYARTGIPVLVSQHRDGELITQILHYLGGDTIRGSSTRGGDRAVRDMLERSRDTHLSVTPDGPRGPRRKMQLGPIYLASRGNMKVVPIGICAKGAWRTKSWDQLAVPKPFMPIYVYAGEPIAIPADLPRDEMEPYRELCEQRLNQAQERAEARAR